jgi:hypothetical protein
MAKWYNAKAQEQPKFKVGDKVMIDARNFKTKRPSKKLDHKKIGPVRIVKLIGKRAVRVELPTSMKQHNVFNVTSLEHYRESRIPGRRQEPPPPDEIEGEKFWVVEGIAKSRLNKREKRVEYLVFWKGYPPEEATSGKKDPVRTQASVGTVACVKPPWTAWEGWKRARSKQPACAHHPRWGSPASENAQMSTFQERAYGRRMASQEWQKSKPTCNEHS